MHFNPVPLSLILPRLPSLLVCTLLIAALVACSKPKGDHIVRIDGSSTSFPITEAVAEEFQIATRIRTTVGISGTGGGFKKLCRNEIDITQASRPILQDEMAACQAAGVDYIELPVAYDALTVVINPKNAFIDALTVAELKTMWEPAAQNKIKSWQQVNPAWPDRPLRLFGAGADSGTFDYFTEAIVGTAKSSRGDFTASEDDNVIVKGVAGDVDALGYFGFSYYIENQDTIKAVPIISNAGSAGVLPSEESVMDGSYIPLSRPLFMYVNTKSLDREDVLAFVNFYLDHAKELIEEVKFTPLPEHEHAAVVAHWQARKTGTGFNGKPEVGLKIADLLNRM